MHIGFLFNHEGAHQIGHALPIAVAMARRENPPAVTVYVAPGAAEGEARRLLDEAEATLRLVTLKGPGWAGRAISMLSGDSVPGRRVSILRRNRKRFADLDALVVPEKTSLLLKSLFGFSELPLIHTRHGAGDRAVGFNRSSVRFDLVLLSGRKIRDRLRAKRLLRRNGHAIVGYPKFDSLRRTPRPAPLFDNGRPTVLYNPHPSAALSSWYRMGPAILEHFARQNRFNLIFAPHVMLFAKRNNISLSPPGWAKVPQVPESVRACPHIHIDLGSKASVDMTYTRMADIYLGDASSQIYEFLAEPRPAIFVDPRNTAWQHDPNFTHWRAGPVVADLAGLDAALTRALQAPDAYRSVQDELFAYSFDLTDEPSAERAARAILEWLRPGPR